MQQVLIVRSSHSPDLARVTNQISLVYFLFDGVYVANKYIEMPSDEPNYTQAWQQLAKQHDMQLLVCPASGSRRGITKETIAPGFRFGTIGELVEACAQAQKVHCL